MKPNQVTVGLAREEDTDTILELNKLEYGRVDVLAHSRLFAHYEYWMILGEHGQA